MKEIKGCKKVTIEELARAYSGSKPFKKHEVVVQVVENGQIVATTADMGGKPFLKLSVGAFEKPQHSGWKFHISVDPTDIVNYEKSIVTILKFCVKKNIDFKFVKLDHMKGFVAGRRQAGKIFTLYIPNGGEQSFGNSIIDDLGSDLKRQGIKPGTNVTTDLRVNDHIYYRFSGANEDEGYIVAKKGNALPDNIKDIYAKKRANYERLNPNHGNPPEIIPLDPNEQSQLSRAQRSSLMNQEQALEYVRRQYGRNDIIAENELFKQINQNIDPKFERTPQQKLEQKNRQFHLIDNNSRLGHVVLNETFINIHPLGSKTDSDWKFHISVDPSSSNYKKAFDIIYKYCQDNKIAFKIVRWNKTHRFSENMDQQGKFFTIYLPKKDTKSTAYQFLDKVGPEFQRQNIKAGPAVKGDLAMPHEGSWFYYRNQKGKRGVSPMPPNTVDIFQVRRRQGPRKNLNTPVQINKNTGTAAVKTSRIVELKKNVNGDINIPHGTRLEDILGKKQASALKDDFNSRAKNMPSTKSQTGYTPFDIEYQSQQQSKAGKPAFNPFDIDHTNALEKNDGSELPFRESTAPLSHKNKQTPPPPSPAPSKALTKKSDAFFKRMCNYVSKNKGKMIKPPGATGSSPLIYPVTTAIEMLGGYFGSMVKGWLDYLINVSVSYFALLVSTTGSFFSTTQALIIRLFGTALPKTCSVLLTVNGFCNSVCGYVVKGGKATCNIVKSGGQALIRGLMSVGGKALQGAISAARLAGNLITIEATIVASGIIGFSIVASKVIQLLIDGPEPNRVKTTIFVRKNGAFSASRSCLDGPRVGRLADIPEDILPLAMRQLREESFIPQGYLSEEHYKRLIIIAQEIQMEHRKNMPGPLFKKKEVMHFPFITSRDREKVKSAQEIHEIRSNLANAKKYTEKRLKKGANILNKFYTNTCMNIGIKSNTVVHDNLTKISQQTNLEAAMLFDGVCIYYQTINELTQIYYSYRVMKHSKNKRRRATHKKKFKTMIQKYKRGLKKQTISALFGKYGLNSYRKKLKKMGAKSFKNEIKNRKLEFRKFDKHSAKYVALIEEVMSLQKMVNKKIEMMDDETMINLSAMRGALQLDQQPIVEPR